jgi:hypothetical protein
MERGELGPEKAIPESSTRAVLPLNAHGIADLAERTQLALSRALAGFDDGYQRAIAEHCVERRRELTLENDGALEHLLIEQVVTCELAATYADQLAHENDVISIAQAEYLLRRQESTHRRLLSACRALATVRRLRIPAVQLNVAQQQVNVVGLTSGGLVGDGGNEAE